ncbi:MAG: GIY-YIG nuclease family protein [Verrucomicrobiota bacterium]
MFYVYLLQSIEHPDKIYIGFTEDLRLRLQRHNNGSTAHTAKFRPWKITSYHAFESEEIARAFEKYLKSGSGRAFRAKHF